MEIEQVREEMKTEHALTVKKLNESITELQNQLETFETQQVKKKGLLMLVRRV